MRLKALSLFCVASVAILAIASPVSFAQQADRVTGLIMEDGWLAVQANCTECHSAQLIIQNSGSREVWKSRITWMQETQGLQQLHPDLEDAILSYLAYNYGQKQSSRRALLPSPLMPVNPYATVN